MAQHLRVLIKYLSRSENYKFLFWDGSYVGVETQLSETVIGRYTSIANNVQLLRCQHPKSRKAAGQSNSVEIGLIIVALPCFEIRI
jgi:hypothetical protein